MRVIYLENCLGLRVHGKLHKLLQLRTCSWNSPLAMMLMTILFCRSWYCGICFLGVLIWQFFLSPLLPCFTLLPVLLLSCQTHLRYCLFKGRKWLLAGMVVVLLKTDVGKWWGGGVLTCFTFLKSAYFFLNDLFK